MDFDGGEVGTIQHHPQYGFQPCLPGMSILVFPFVLDPEFYIKYKNLNEIMFKL